MNRLLKKLIDDIDAKLSKKPLIFASKDIYKSCGLSNVLSNFYNLSYPSKLYDSKIKNTLSALWNKHFTNTKDLIIYSDIISKLQLYFEKGYVLKFFNFSLEEEKFLSNNKIKVFNNSKQISQNFESKINLPRVVKDYDIKIPDYIIHKASDDINDTYAILNKKFKTNELLVFQKEFFHTGLGTASGYKDDIFKMTGFMNNTYVKISRFIAGIQLTVNAVIYKKQVIVGAPQIQINTNDKNIAPSPYITIGNDFGVAYKLLIKDNKLSSFQNFVKKVGSMLVAHNFKGIFGIDCIYDGNDFWLIEINARHTANVDFETHLSLQHDVIPLELIDLCEWLEIDFDVKKIGDIVLTGSQIKLRNTTSSELQINKSLQSGIYKMSGDRPSFNVFNNNDSYVIFVDEDKDISFEFLTEEIFIYKSNNQGILILTHDQVEKKLPYMDEMSRIQSLNDLTYIKNDKLYIKPWTLQLIKTIKEILL